ncbi:MAG: hypothetical protein ACRDTG_29465 [Pseudonocardiaceae bacterium]
MTETGHGSTVYQVSYGLLREELRAVLRAVVEVGSDAEGGRGSVRWRACAALYSLVEGHPVDRRGRCRSCRRPGAVLGRARRRCQVRVTADYWLHQPDETLLLDLLASELNQHLPTSVDPGDRADRPSPAVSCRLPNPLLAARRRPRWLTGTDLLDWIALRRVGEGGVTMLGAHYFDHGRRVPCFVPDAFRRLADGELIDLLDPDYPGGLRRVVITPGGRARYQKLCGGSPLTMREGEPTGEDPLAVFRR